MHNDNDDEIVFDKSPDDNSPDEMFEAWNTFGVDINVDDYITADENIVPTDVSNRQGYCSKCAVSTIGSTG
jgi:hypothetical protein